MNPSSRGAPVRLGPGHAPRLRPEAAIRTLLSATASPLSSIFGSGFLVIVPILAAAVGSFSPLAMAVVCAVAYLLGAAIRFNIRYAEPALAATPGRLLLGIERASDVALILAYVISVCLYIHILSSFLLGGFGVEAEATLRWLTTAIIAAIALVGVTRGLGALDRLEMLGLAVTLLIVVLLGAGFAVYDASVLSGPGFTPPATEDHTPWEVATIVAGTLIVVQGFETPRYLGASYDMETRIRASRLSQWIAATVYILFVALALPALHTLGGAYDDNSLIDLVAAAAPLLALPLVVAAVLSQFSAAVADTHAATGNMAELTRGWLDDRRGCLLVAAGAILLTWFADTLQILAIASRAFAVYYALQCAVTFIVAQSLAVRIAAGALVALCTFVALFAVPAG
ncbi:hypothetical protein LX81_02244 [Palleronia aestuarii]|uniref:Amino acid transporter n=1 Tax=Palleronia aestuarii TaxID=568105 RepID=A0A2W7NH12_9RHOB|nr:hypothetical protein [Palleronia aestuarii]PZX15974.1 hypothetical protein LX81_02244 [Palleronia aestuarii]